MPSISQIAYDLLADNKVLPIPIETIIINRGIRLLPHDFDEDVSGVLVIENGEATIGYNKNEHRVRNRFTMAHELGHFELHKKVDLFVDRDFKVMFRGTPNNTTMQKYEREANQFAACILMPEDVLKHEIAELHFDYTDETSIKILAKKFDVSAVAMSYRISDLRLF